MADSYQLGNVSDKLLPREQLQLSLLHPAARLLELGRPYPNRHAQPWKLWPVLSYYLQLRGRTINECVKSSFLDVYRSVMLLELQFQGLPRVMEDELSAEPERQLKNGGLALEYLSSVQPLQSY